MPEDKQMKSSEAAQKKANDLGVNLDEVTGTGQDGAVRVSDVQRAAAEGSASNAKFVRVKHEYGPGEYVFGRDDLDEELRIPAGVSFPVSQQQYDYLLDKDNPNRSKYLEDASDENKGGDN